MMDDNIIFQMTDLEMIDWIRENGLFIAYLHALQNNGLLGRNRR